MAASVKAMRQQLAVEAYPTEAAEKKRDAKRAAKAAGTEIVVKKRPKKVQDHFDDCGNDLSGIGVDLDNSCYVEEDDLPPKLIDSSSDEDGGLYEDSHTFFQHEPSASAGNFPAAGTLLNTGEGNFPEAGIQIPLEHFLAEAEAQKKKGIFADVMQICGGEGRPGLVALRRRMESGGNFDLVTGYDLNKTADQRKVLQAVDALKPLVLIMSPVCTPFGPRAHLNRSLHPETYRQSYAEAAPHGKFCGHLAMVQYANGRFFIAEHPEPSLLFDEPARHFEDSH